MRMKPACIVKGHHAGLFSLINKVMTCMRLYERVHVDFTSGVLYGEDGVNLWDELFAWNDPAEDGADIITDYPDHAMTGPGAGALYLSGDAWRSECHELWKRMRCRFPGFRLDPSVDRVACLIRNTQHFAEQPDDRQQTLDDYAAAFESVRRPDSMLHVVCRDEESLRWMGERFNIQFGTHIERTGRRDDPEIHLNRPQSVNDAVDCIYEVTIMSRCRALIHPVSNIATAALYMNPKLESIYLR